MAFIELQKYVIVIEIIIIYLYSYTYTYIKCTSVWHCHGTIYCIEQYLNCYVPNADHAVNSRNPWRIFIIVDSLLYFRFRKSIWNRYRRMLPSPNCHAFNMCLLRPKIYSFFYRHSLMGSLLFDVESESNVWWWEEPKFN